jgi:hypothetical protein
MVRDKICYYQFIFKIILYEIELRIYKCYRWKVNFRLLKVMVKIDQKWCVINEKMEGYKLIKNYRNLGVKNDVKNRPKI